jgi:hypothetical protein
MELVLYRWDEQTQEGFFTYELTDGTVKKTSQYQPLNVSQAREEGRILKLSPRDKKLISRQLEQARQARQKREKRAA